MREFAGDVVPPAQQLAVDDDADADAVRHADEHQIADRRRDLARFPHLRERARAAGVFDVHDQTCGRRQPFAQVHVAPPERRRVEHATRSGVHHAGHDNSDALALPDISGMGLEELIDSRGQRRNEPAWIASRGHADDVGPLAPHGIGEHQERAARPNVHRHAGSLAGVDVEERRPAPARDLAGRAFDDVPLLEQLLHEEADGAAAHFHAARQVGAGDRLVAADQSEGDLAVDVARRSAGRDVEACGINAAHLHQFRAKYAGST